MSTATEPPDVDQQIFRDSMSRWASGVTVVTAAGPDGPAGITASAFSSLSLTPPLVLVCIDHRAGSHDPICTADGFAVHILERRQADLSDRFAGRFGDDKFAGVATEPGAFDAPLLPLGLVRLQCVRHDAPQGGDHTILIGRVVAAELGAGEPLLHYARAYGAFASGK